MVARQTSGKRVQYVPAKGIADDPAGTGGRRGTQHDQQLLDMLSPLGLVLVHEQAGEEFGQVVRADFRRDEVDVAFAEDFLEQLLLAAEVTADQRDIDTGVACDVAEPTLS